MTDLPPEYFEDMHRLDAAASAWFKAHPFAEPRFRIRAFEDEIKSQAGRPLSESVAIAAGLGEVIDRIADNDDAKRFLRDIDEATGKRATYMQFKAIYEAQLRAHVKRGQMQMREGDWRCPGCGALCDGVSVADGKPETPPPGSVGVCFYCAGLQCVNDTGSGWRPFGDDEVRALPKATRKGLLQLRNLVRQRLEEEKARS